MKEKVLLSTAYLAPIQYFSKLIRYDEVYMEVNDNFIKQTYRNRCKIYGANGALQLSIPVKKDKPKTKVKNIQIDYDTNWQKIHWKSIESAYRSSPYFEFYADDFLPFYHQKFEHLVEYNLKLQEMILEHLGCSVSINITQEFIDQENIEYDDFRDQIHPKKELNDNDFLPTEYTQVFREKHGFIENLSIIDLLFNEGPNAISFI